MPAKNEPQGLIAWLTRLKADITEDGMISRVDLLHTVESEGVEKLESYKFRDDTDTGDAGQILYDAAMHDADTRISGQPQRYVVVAYRHEDSREPEASYPFLLRAAKPVMGVDTEPPTDKGAMAHYMRHDENMHRIMVGNLESQMTRLNEDIERERRLRKMDEESQFKLRLAYEDLLDKKLDRELDRAREAASAKRTEDMWGMVVSVAPLLLGKLMGGSELPVPASMRDKAIQKFLKNLSEKEMMGIFSSLENHNKLPLFELVKSYREDELKEQQARPEGLRDGDQEKEEAKNEVQH